MVQSIVPRQTENAEHYRWGGVCDGWHLLKSDELSVIQEQVPAGAGEVVHLHHRARQFFYVLSGVATLEFEGQSVSFGPGQGVDVPCGTAHRFVNRSDQEVRFLVISAPPSAGDRTNLAGPQAA